VDLVGPAFHHFPPTRSEFPFLLHSCTCQTRTFSKRLFRLLPLWVLRPFPPWKIFKGSSGSQSLSAVRLTTHPQNHPIPKPSTSILAGPLTVTDFSASNNNVFSFLCPPVSSADSTSMVELTFAHPKDTHTHTHEGRETYNYIFGFFLGETS